MSILILMIVIICLLILVKLVTLHKSRIKRFLLLLDTDTINGLTTMGLLSHSSIRPLISKSCIASTTNSLWLDFGEISNLTHEYYEYEQGQADIIVKNRLKKHYNFWKNIGMD
jgi:hypothetical protein